MARTVSVKLLADIGQYSTNMRRAAAETKSLSSEIDKAAKGGRLDEVTNMATGLGLGLVGAAAVAVKFSMDFEKQMSSVKAATHASSTEIDQLREASLQAGKDTAFSATEAAKGVEELAKAGVSTSDILGGGLSGALDLAAAGELDVGEAAETAASALTQFKLKGKDVPHVADLLAAAAGKAQGSVHDMGQALNQAGLVASQTGLSIEETTGTLAAFANAGLIGSDAGTSFKQMLLMLQAPSGKTKDLMDDLGISAYDASGQFIGITALAGQLKSQLSKLTPEVRANAMAQIFGADATRAASILYEQGQDGIQGWIDKTNDSGYAAETAAMKTDNLAGDLDRLKGSLETAAIESGGGLNQGLRLLTKTADGLVTALDDLPAGTTATVTALAGVAGVITLGLVAWVKARTAIASVVAELNAVGPAGARAATGLQAATKWAGRAAVAFVALEAAGYVFDKLGVQAADVRKLTEALANMGETGNVAGELTTSFGKDLEDFNLVARSAEAATHGFWGGLNDIVSKVPMVNSAVDSMNEWLHGTSFNDATERMKSLDESFSAFIATQKDTTKATEIWNRLWKESGLDMAEFQKLLPSSTAAMTELQKSTHAAADGQEVLGVETGKTADEIQAEKEQTEQLKKAFDALFDQYMSVDKAAIQYQATLEKTNKELKEGKRTLDITSQAGRDNRAATLDMIDAINDSRTANINNGMAVKDADKKYRQQIDTLKATMLNLGYTKKDVEALIGRYRQVPGKVGTSVETPNLPKAREGIKGYKGQLDKLQKQIKTHVSVEGDAAAYKKLERLLVAQQAAKKGISVSAAQSAFNKNAYAAGGWTGPGGKYDPAGIVHADEYVIRKESRQKIERAQPGLLDELNATGQLPGHAAGGLVMPFKVNANVTQVMSMADALSKVATYFSKDWPSSPMAQRGDSGIWRKVVSMIKATGPMSGEFGNGYRPGDPKWHGSGRAVDWMGYNQDRLATYLANQRPLELIHRTRERDYAYTRGRNKGSFNEALMNAHRNHIHIAMAQGGVIDEPVFGVGRSGASYSFGEGGRPETVTPGILPAGGTTVVNLNVNVPPTANRAEIGREVAGVLESFLERGGSVRVRGTRVL